MVKELSNTLDFADEKSDPISDLYRAQSKELSATYKIQKLVEIQWKP